MSELTGTALRKAVTGLLGPLKTLEAGLAAMQKAEDVGLAKMEARAGRRLRKHDGDGDADDSPACPSCGGPGFHLGTLGNREHFRCRGCGGDYSQGKPAQPTQKAELATTQGGDVAQSPGAAMPGKPQTTPNDEGSGGDSKKLTKGEQVKCGVCKEKVWSTSAGMVGYHGKAGNKCSGGGSDPDRGQWDKPKHVDGPMRNHPDGEMHEPAQKSEPTDGSDTCHVCGQRLYGKNAGGTGRVGHHTCPKEAQKAYDEKRKNNGKDVGYFGPHDGHEEPTHKSEPVAKAWRAGGPQPKAGPMAPTPKPAAPVEKALSAGTKKVLLGTALATGLALGGIKAADKKGAPTKPHTSERADPQAGPINAAASAGMAKTSAGMNISRAVRLTQAAAKPAPKPAAPQTPAPVAKTSAGMNVSRAVRLTAAAKPKAAPATPTPAPAAAPMAKDATPPRPTSKEGLHLVGTAIPPKPIPGRPAGPAKMPGMTAPATNPVAHAQQGLNRMTSIASNPTATPGNAGRRPMGHLGKCVTCKSEEHSGPC